MNQASPVAVVTGVGPGTGAAVVRRFSRGGYAVAMLARTHERLAVLEREIAHARAYPCDVTAEAQLDAAIEAIRAELGAPKVLIHNAVGGAFGNFMEIDPQVLNQSFQVNTMALLYLARRLAPAMVATGEGAIIAAGINQALSPDREFLVGNTITIADICFVAELSLFCNERTRARELERQGLEPILQARVDAEFPRAMAHFSRLRTHAAFAPDMEPYLKKIEAVEQAEARRSLAP